MTTEEQGFLTGIDRRFRPFGSTLVLEGKVDPGRILASRNVVEAADGSFRFSPIGEVELKGKGAVEAYVLEGRTG